MKKILIFLIVIVLLAVSLIITKSYWSSFSEKRRSGLTLYGNVDIRQVDLGFRTNGRVETMLFEEGDEVHKGDLMGFLEKQPYEDQVKQAQAHIESVKANLTNAEKLYNRREGLVSLGGVSQQELEDALANRDSLAADLNEAMAALGTATTNLNDTRVYAPTDGFILTRIREPGSVVREADPIYTLSIKTPVWIRAYVNEPNLGNIFPGMTAEVYTDTKNGKIYKGKIGFISPIAEFTPKTVETTQLRTDLVYRLRIYVDDPDLGLRQGMPVTIHLNTDIKEEQANLHD